MSDMTYTGTRQMAQSAAMKAQDAYSQGRQAFERIAALEALVADLAVRLQAVERDLDNQRQMPNKQAVTPVSRRKSA